MKPILADMDEIVFEGRHKEYGAYEMRKKYNRFLERSALIAFMAFLILTMAPKAKEWITGLGGDEDETLVVTPVMLSELPPPPPLEEEQPPPPPPPVAPPPPRAKIEFKIPKPSAEVEEEVTVKEYEEVEKSEADIGTEDIEGSTEGYDFSDIDGTGDIEEIEVPVKEKEIGPDEFVMLEKEPAPVNMDELRKLIGYPPMAKEAEIEGKVILRVQVSKSGKYVKHITIKDPHPILTKAVTDQIRNLSFTPGIQAGKPIKVWVTIPFDFKLLK